MNTELILGVVLSDTSASQICNSLDFACEIRSGNFRYHVQDKCTIFTAPRKLGLTSYRIARAMVDGIRLGMFAEWEI